MTIELRYIEREIKQTITDNEWGGVTVNGGKFKILQFRTWRDNHENDDGSHANLGWSEWQDVPTVVSGI